MSVGTRHCTTTSRRPGRKRCGHGPQVVDIAVVLVMLGAPWLTGVVAAGATATPPEQPATGPGGADYRYAAVERMRAGTAPGGASIFRPAQPTAIPTADATDALPLVIFLHGFIAVDPTLYQGWIDHLVRRGTVVIYPDYQPANPLAGSQDAFLRDMMAGVRAALRRLDRQEGAPIAVVGHSLGGVLAVNYAASAGRAGFPTPDLLMVVEPGGCATCGASRDFGVYLPADASFPDELTVSVVVGEDDTLVGDSDARWIWCLVGHLPREQRAYVEVQSDDHGEPNLVADHLLPQTSGGGTMDALDWNALWRLLDLQLECASTSSACAHVFGNGGVEYMGTWSDGEPVQPLRIESSAGDAGNSLTSPRSEA